LGGLAMKPELLAQSAAFALFSVLLAVLLGVAIRFEVSRLVLSIAVAGVCLLAELYVIVKILHRLWKWSGAITGVLLATNRRAKWIGREAKAR
jgi:hypothetical protein